MVTRLLKVAPTRGSDELTKRQLNRSQESRRVREVASITRHRTGWAGVVGRMGLPKLIVDSSTISSWQLSQRRADHVINQVHTDAEV
jgi:hypothetical protein